MVHELLMKVHEVGGNVFVKFCKLSIGCGIDHVGIYFDQLPDVQLWIQ